MQFDYHVHSSVSPDGGAAMEEMCRGALENGISEIVFTEHFEFYTPGFHGYPFNRAYLEGYFDTLARCRAEFAGALTILAGVELGQSYHNPGLAAELLGRFPFDYVIGSVHKLRDVDLGSVDYGAADLDALCRENLARLYQLADGGDFDCLGHFDLVKRYAARAGVRADLLDYPEECGKIFSRLIARGKGIELNTSGLRQQARESLPSPGLLKLWRELGGQAPAIGSDAHLPGDVGADFGAAAEIAREAGFPGFARYRGRARAD